MDSVTLDRDTTGLIAAVAVAVAWGVTNPLIARGARTLHTRVTAQQTRHNTLLRSGLGYASIFITTWQYWLPLACNLAASALFYWAVSRAALSRVGPIANSLTTVFTLLSGWLLFGERLVSRTQLAGLFLLSVGSYCIVTS